MPSSLTLNTTGNQTRTQKQTMSKPMNKMNETKTLIVTETVRYEFEVPASMPESDLSLRRFFAAKSNPWSDADFSAVTERDFEMESA
jgi:hypothetical protein